jgi:predicted ester cyclase
MERYCSIVFLAIMAPVLSRGGEPIQSQAERNKAVALRVFEENFNQGRFQVADEIYAPDFRNHGLHRDVDLRVDQQAVHDEKKAFPNLKMTVTHVIAEGDLVAVRWVFRGTHAAAGYGGLPATGTRLEMSGMTIWRFVDGKIHDEWTEFDELRAYSQVISHMKGYLLLGALVLVAALVVVERLLWAVACNLYRKLRA